MQLTSPKKVEISILSANTTVLYFVLLTSLDSIMLNFTRSFVMFKIHGKLASEFDMINIKKAIQLFGNINYLFLRAYSKNIDYFQ